MSEEKEYSSISHWGMHKVEDATVYRMVPNLRRQFIGGCPYKQLSGVDLEKFKQGKIEVIV